MPQQVSRRTLTTGAAWAVPVVMATSAAPALAASCGQQIVQYTMPFNTSSPTLYTRTRDGSGGRTGKGTAISTSAGSQTVTVTLASKGASIMSNNLTAAGDTNGGYNGPGVLKSDGLQIQQVPNGGTQTVTLTFSRAVTNLTFKIADIDREADQYYDDVWLDGTFRATLGSALQGSGTSASPFRAGSTSAPVNADTAANMVTVTYSGPVTSVTISYRSDSAETAGTTGMQVFLTGMSFEAAAC